MEKNDKRSSLENIFIIVSGIELALGMLQMCKIVLPYTRFVLWLFFGCYVVVIIKAFASYAKVEKVLFLCMLPLGIVSYLSCGNNTFLKMIIYFWALKDIDKKRLLRTMLGTMIVTTSGIIVCSLLFHFGTLFVRDIRGASRGWNGVRWSFGFANPNMLQFVIFHIMVFIVCLKETRWKIRIYLWLGLLQLGFFIATNSLTGMILAISFLLLLVCTELKSDIRWEHILAVAFIVGMFLIIMISLLAAVPVQNRLLNWINKIISGRIDQLSVYTIGENYALPYMNSWKLFSSFANKNGYDMGYIQLFYCYGVIPAIGYLVVLFYGMYCAWKCRAKEKMLLQIWMSCYLFMEIGYFSNYVVRDFLFLITSISIWNSMKGIRRGMYERESNVCHTCL